MRFIAADRAVSPVAQGPSGLEVRLFGPMEVRLGGHPLPRLRSRKGLWLLALLVLRGGRAVERSWLAGTLWPDHDEAHARRSLRQSLHDLRLALGSEAWRLNCEGPRTLHFDLAEVRVDVLDFDAAVAGGENKALAEAVELYAGPLLEDCAEEWSLEARRLREQNYLAALAALAEAAAARGDAAQGAAYLERAVGTDPYREDLQRALMQALAAGGNPTAALLVYRRFRELLSREMAAEPAEETTALFRELRDASRPVVGSRTEPVAARRNGGVPRLPHAPPLPLTPLIGREREVAELLIAVRGSRLVTLTGTGGIGKTRLAIEVAGAVAGEFEEAPVFVNLAPVRGGERVPDAVRAALGLGAGDAEPVEGLRQWLAGRSLLLLLDNCEHLRLACAALAEELLGQCPRLRILVTSREALGLRGERAWRVPSLAVPTDAVERAQAAGDAAAYPAVRMFLDRARAAEIGFELSPDTAASVVDLCRRVDGIPLAIELAAARVRAMPVHQIARRLHDGFKLLTGGDSAFPARHQTLAATFDWSWELLTRSEQTLLVRLSAFNGGWTLEAAEVVCGGGALSEADILDLLTALVDKSLVQYHPTAGRAEARYSLLETIRQYAAERLPGMEDPRATRDRHRDFFLELAETARPHLRGPEQALWFERLEVEHPNLRTALEWSRREDDGAKQLRLAVALSRFWDTHGHLREGRAQLSEALGRMDPDAPLELREAAYVHGGWMAYAEGDRGEARRHYAAALATLRSGADRKTLADVLNCLALVLLEDGELGEARKLFEESLALCRELGGIARLGSVLGNLGSLALRQGDYRAAREYLEQSATWCEFAGDEQLHGLALHDLSVAAVQEQRWEEARERCAASLRLLHRCGAVVDIPTGLDQMARIARAEGHWESAARLLGAAGGLRTAFGLAQRPPRPDDLDSASGAPSRAVLDRWHREGERMELDQAVTLALAGSREPALRQT